MKTCECGCGLEPKPGNRYIFNHGKKNANNGRWKGDNVGYGALHNYIKKHLPKPDRCQQCNGVKRLCVACVTRVYIRDFTNWKWLCYLCHNKLDKTIDMSSRMCSICESDKTCIIKRTGKPHWHYSKLTRELLCNNCRFREY